MLVKIDKHRIARDEGRTLYYTLNGQTLTAWLWRPNHNVKYKPFSYQPSPEEIESLEFKSETFLAEEYHEVFKEALEVYEKTLNREADKPQSNDLIDWALDGEFVSIIY